MLFPLARKVLGVRGNAKVILLNLVYYFLSMFGKWEAYSSLHCLLTVSVFILVFTSSVGSFFQLFVVLICVGFWKGQPLEEK